MYKPTICIISFSAIYDDIQLMENLKELEETSILNDCTLVLGGRTIPEVAPKLLERTLFVYSMTNFINQISDFLKN